MFKLRNNYILLALFFATTCVVASFAVSETGANEPLLNANKMLSYLKGTRRKDVVGYKPGKAFNDAIEKYKQARKTGKLDDESQALNSVQSHETSDQLMDKVSQLLEVAKAKIEDKEANSNEAKEFKQKSNRMSDEEFNRQLRDYNFKMPANYRIIVR